MKNDVRHRAVLISSLLIWWGAGSAMAVAGTAGRLPGSVIPVLARARSVASSVDAAHQSLTLTLVLRREHPRRFRRYLQALYDPRSPLFRHFLPGRALADRFGPTRVDYERVLGYLRAQGFQVLAGSADRLTLTVRASRTRIERTLRIHIGDYRLGKRRFYANDRAPWLPATIAPQVQAIVGLSNLARPWHVGAGDVKQSIWGLIPSEAQTLLTCFSPAMVKVIQKGKVKISRSLAVAIEQVTAPVACEINMIAAYAQSYGQFPDPTPGTGETIGLLELTNYHPSDVQNYLNLVGIGSNFANLSEVDVNGGVAAPGPGESEVLLDIDAVMSLAPGAKVVVFDSPFQGPGTFQSLLNAMISAGVNVISNSWAYCENETDAADVQSINSILQTAAADGITVVSGTGDHGSTCLDGAGNTIPVPADAQYITAVGGTEAQPSLLGSYGSETWWNGVNGTPPTGQGGFGVSRFFPSPTYQTPLTSSAMRSVPDVSAPADPLQGFRICQADNGGCPSNFLYGGTSVAAPIWAAIIAVLNQELGHNLGFLNPTLYGLAGSSAFHSAASLGSDFAHVGLGSPNVNELRRLLAGSTTGAVDLGHSAIQVLPIPVFADGTSVAPVSVTLLDSNFYTVSGQAVTLTVNSGSHAVITTVRGVTDLNSGAALFEVTDTVPETVTLTASTNDGTLTRTATVDFVSPSATAGNISASLSSVPNDGTSSTTITVTLQNAASQGASGKTVDLAQGAGHSSVSAPNPAVTDSSGQIQFIATDTTAETVTYTATDLTDGDMPIPGSAAVTFGAGTGTPPCASATAITPAAGYAVTSFATGFGYGNCIGPTGVAFDQSGDLYVADDQAGGVYRFPPQGGVADGVTLLPQSMGYFQPIGLAYSKDGTQLYLASSNCNGTSGSCAIFQIDPTTGALLRGFAFNGNGYYALATDPISGDLFATTSRNGNVYRISNPGSANPTVSVYATPGFYLDGLVFAPNGTLYSAATSNGGDINQIDGTNSATPGASTVIATIPGSPDGLAVAVDPANPGQVQALYANTNGGTLYKIDLTQSPAVVSPVFSGGSRGDLVAVGPDGCLYATQTDQVVRVTAADGSCSLTPSSAAPLIKMTPASVATSPNQGGTVSFTATLQNVAKPSGIPVELVVDGVNAGVHEGVADTNGNVTLTYDGVYSGSDQVFAHATVGGSQLVSNAVNLNWAAGAHTTFLSLNDNPALVAANQPVTLTANLVDVSADPQAPLASQTVDLSLDGQSCSAATDSTGTASCTVTPTSTGVATLNASFAGGVKYVAAAATRRVDVLVAPPTVSISVTPASITAGGSATLDWSSTDASACTASGAWSGSQATAGKQTVSPATSGTDTYTLTCTDATGTASASAVLAVAALGSVTVTGHSGGGGAVSVPVLALLAGLLALRWLARRDRSGA